MFRIRTAMILACAAAMAWGSAASAQTFGAPVARVMVSGTTYSKANCAGPVPAGYARCFSLVVTDRTGNALVNRFVTNRMERTASAPVVPTGYGPLALNIAYNFSTAAVYPNGVGSPKTIVAIVDAFGYPNAERDMGIYRKFFNLPACTTANGCFSKITQTGAKTGYPAFNAGWAGEQALDLDMVSAMCPNCKIILVQTTNSQLNNLAAGVNTAVAKGAHVVSNSYGGAEAGSQSLNTSYHHAGVAIVASTGDCGYDNQNLNNYNPGCGTQAQTANFPASSQFVTAAGGTTLVFNPTLGFTETAWKGAGSGCSKVYPKPAWQKDTLCTKRMEADVSAVADPATYVAIYAPVNATTSGWNGSGGTSVASPIIAGLYGVNGGAVTLGSVYATTTHLTDVIGGTNGNCGKTYFCVGKKGYDGPTGLGSPTSKVGF
jgi:subtilase family serine protease